MAVAYPEPSRVQDLWQRPDPERVRQLHNVHTLVRRTYGKGLIQSVYELSDSSGLVLTVGKYLTPARTDIDREGIQPDFRHPPSPPAAAARLAACRVPSPA